MQNMTRCRITVVHAPLRQIIFSILIARFPMGKKAEAHLKLD